MEQVKWSSGESAADLLAGIGRQPAQPQNRAVLLRLFATIRQSRQRECNWQTLLLGALFVGMAIITDSMYALAASSLAERLRGNKHFYKSQRYFAGLVYVGLGITTALTGSKK